jgi:alanine racemase
MVRYPEDHMDAVRTGAWLYGVYPRGYAHPQESRLALTVKARIAQLHAVPAGSCLGYDETHPVSRDSIVATLSCGYIDGYPRLNSMGEVEICGKRAPVVGLVCMDQMMVDVTDIPEAKEGDEVILIGGEAYLRDDCWDVVRRIRARGMQPLITTGGRAFSPERAKAAKERAEKLLAQGGLNDHEYKAVSAKLRRALVRLSVK